MGENLLFKTALSKAMAYCSRRESCNSDIRVKIKSWGIENEDADKIISTLQNENFLNELRYARSFAKDKFLYNKWGKVKIASHLKVKGISSENIKKAFEEIDNKEYNEMIKKIIASHRKTVKAKNDYDMKARLLRFGLSRGFESNILYEILGGDFDSGSE
jgi:regulatory protein